MKNVIAGLLVLVAGTASAAFVPAQVTRQNQATQVIDIRLSAEQQIAARAAAGYHFASIDMDGATWKVENQILKELQALGYQVKLGEEKHVYGWDSLNGALVVTW